MDILYLIMMLFGATNGDNENSGRLNLDDIKMSRTWQWVWFIAGFLFMLALFWGFSSSGAPMVF